MKKWKNRRGDLLFLGGLFIGMGIGFITEQIIGGVFLGLGLGYLGMASVSKK